MKFAPLLRATALVTAVALIPAATTGLAAVDAKSGPEFGKLMAVYERIKSSYVEPVDDDKLLKGAIDGMLATLDPHSAYLDARDFENLRTQTEGSYGGLGLSVTMDDGAVKVIAPTKGSPADLAGIKAGDFITHLDGKLIYGGSLDEAVDQMRGVPGTQIKLSVFRPGRDEPFDVTITRKIIELKPVELEMKGNVAVISVSSFSADVGASVQRAWNDAKATCAATPVACSMKPWPCRTCSSTRAPSSRSGAAMRATPKSTRQRSTPRAISPRAFR